MTHSSTMSHDRVRFFISDSYYGNTRNKDALRCTLEKAFGMGMGMGHSDNAMTGHYGGFYIICRPSQFARFLIFRDAAGLKNGFKDLGANLYVPGPPQFPSDRVSKKTGVPVDLVMRVLRILNMSQCDVEAAMAQGSCDNPTEIDVSRNKYDPC